MQISASGAGVEACSACSAQEPAQEGTDTALRPCQGTGQECHSRPVTPSPEGDPSAPGGLPRNSPGEDGFPCAPGNVEPAPVQAKVSPPPSSPSQSPKPRRGHCRDCLAHSLCQVSWGSPATAEQRNNSQKGFCNPLWPWEWIPLPLLCQLNECPLPALCSPIPEENWSCWEQGCGSGSRAVILGAVWDPDGRGER